MRICKTVRDLKDLLSDADAVLELTDVNELYIRFIEQPTKPITDKPIRVYEPMGQKLGHRTVAAAVRGLTNSSEFWRKTTTVDQVGRFAMCCTDYGKLKVCKKAGQPITIVAENHNQAQNLFDAVAQIS